MVEKKNVKKKRHKSVFTIGKRKAAVARAITRLGSGNVMVNGRSVNILHPEPIRLFVSEPLIIAGDVAKTVDIDVNVNGGGVFGQATAVRQAISKALVEFSPQLKKRFLDYDRSLLVSDARQTEPHKPSRSSAGPRRHKQRSKR